ncbi:MAG: hypothetical protein MZV70_58905 [Desulfobacterales bacterium]|nr:hypothetical protein [Desulfobacterales bacterium]
MKRDCRDLSPELHDLLPEAFTLTDEEERELREWRSPSSILLRYAAERIVA